MIFRDSHLSAIKTYTLAQSSFKKLFLPLIGAEILMIKMENKQKTLPASTAVLDYIQKQVSETLQPDLLQLLDTFEQASGFPAVMWGSSIVGFGRYSYRYASGHSGESMLVGFSPRAKAISLYLNCNLEENKELLDQLGKFTSAKSCLYIKKIADIDHEVLKKLIKISMAATLKAYPQEQ